MTNYAEADTKAQWFQSKYPGADLRLGPETMVVVLHTTEGTSWPGYNEGATAPNYTYLPRANGSGQWRAHFPDEKSSRALRNEAGGVQTNTLNCVQVELVGTCDPRYRERWGSKVAGKDYVFWPNASRKQLMDVAEFLADMHNRHGLKLVAPKTFLPYPASYGKNPQRMTFTEWRNAKGVVGHQHVPENSHGDPGNIPINQILSFARAMVAPAPSRGKRVDHAIKDLSRAKGKGERGSLIKKALKALKKIKPLKEKR